MKEDDKDFEKLRQRVLRVLIEEVKGDAENEIKSCCLKIVQNSTITAEWYTHDNWDGGFDIYNILCLTDVNLYVEIQSKMIDICKMLLTMFNKLEKGSDQYNDIAINIKDKEEEEIKDDAKLQGNTIPFIVIDSLAITPEYLTNIDFAPAELPSFVLAKCSWDDYGYKTSFTLFYCDTEGKSHRVGAVKIMEVSTDCTAEVLPESFLELPDSFCSLGINHEYYQNIRVVFGGNKRLIKNTLTALQDAAYDHKIADTYCRHHIFRRSLLRENSSERALRVGCLHVQGERIVNKYNFKYKYTPPFNNKTSVEIDFRFNSNCTELERIYGLIGENGTGKSNLLKAIAQTHNDSIDNCFVEEPPIFSQLLTVSYTPFNDYMPLENIEPIFKHIFCGLQYVNKKDSILDMFIRDFYTIITRGYLESWYSAIIGVIPREVLCECTNVKSIEHESYEWFVDFKLYDDNNNIISQDREGVVIDRYRTKCLIDSLSSGEANYLMSMTALIANIRYDSLLLIDEPEQHMHPKAISILMIKIGELLSEFQSFAIIATHSPLVVRELLSKNVYIFRRENDILTTPKISMESFGEDISILNSCIFNGDEHEKRFEKLVRDMISTNVKYDFNDIVEELENRFLKLGVNTKLLIQQLLKEIRNENY